MIEETSLLDEENKAVSLHESHTSRSSTYKFYWTHVRQHACEFITAMILLFNACASPVEVITTTTADNSTTITTTFLPLMPAFTAGMTVFALLTMFHYVSVAHISPTVTFGFAMGGSFEWKLVPSYIVCQILGSIAGALLAQVNY